MSSIDRISQAVTRQLTKQLKESLAAELQRLRSRALALVALERGERHVRRLWVKAHTVPAHTVRRHERIIITKR